MSEYILLSYCSTHHALFDLVDILCKGLGKGIEVLVGALEQQHRVNDSVPVEVGVRLALGQREAYDGGARTQGDHLQTTPRVRDYMQNTQQSKSQQGQSQLVLYNYCTVPSTLGWSVCSAAS